MQSELKEKDLIGIDLLRFLLSVTVLIYHFPHFGFPFVGITENLAGFPFYSALRLLYNEGIIAVRIFWMISGLIFFHFYNPSISNGETTFYKFLYYRFSRLYPLHLLTLIIVAVLQYLYYENFGQAFINPANDLIHFVLNLLMINYWSSGFGLSFNGPFWSVSVEMFVYLVFFVFAYIKLLTNFRNTLLLAGIFFIFYSLGILNPFHECLLYFFIGCLIAQNFYRIKSKHIVLLILVLGASLCLQFYTSVMNNQNIARAGGCFIKLSISTLLILVFSRSFNKASRSVKTFLRELGNVTYSMYMIHYSLQIILILIFYGQGQSFFNNNLFFISYILCTAVLGYLVYRFFELPIQTLLRTKKSLFPLW